MGPEIVNRNKDSIFYGDYAGRDLNVTNIIMLEDKEREFVVTHNTNIKPVSYFTGRETELQDLRQRIEEGRKSVLVSGMGGIGKTHICRKLFEEYIDKRENRFFQHIGYIEYDGGIDSSLLRCLKFKKQNDPEKNQKAAWRELEYLASGGKLLLFVDNVNVSIDEDPSLKRLMSIPGAIILTSRRRVFSKEFEPYRIGFLSTGKCREIYEKIRFENSGKRIAEEEVPDLEYIIDTLAARHTITVEFLAHLAWTKNWTVSQLRDELERNKFQLEYIDEEDKLVNIQKSYEKLYDLSKLTEAEQNILEAFSVFPYIPLQVEICNQWLLVDAGVSEDDDILMGLYRKGWLQSDEEQEGYALHPVFAQFIYEKYKPSTEKHVGLILLCYISLKKSKERSILTYKRYTPFAEKILEKFDIGKGVMQAAFMFNLADALVHIAEYKKARKWFEKLLEDYYDTLTDEPQIISIIYSSLTLIYVDQEEYEKAEKLCNENIRIHENLLGKEHLSTKQSYVLLAVVYMFKGEFERGMEMFEKGKEMLDDLPF